MEKLVHQAAKETLEGLIEDCRKRIEFHRSQSERFQETSFIVFSESPPPSLLVSFQDGNTLFDFSSQALQKKFLLRRQLRHSFQMEQLETTLLQLQQEYSMLS